MGLLFPLFEGFLFGGRNHQFGRPACDYDKFPSCFPDQLYHMGKSFKGKGREGEAMGNGVGGRRGLVFFSLSFPLSFSFFLSLFLLLLCTF